MVLRGESRTHRFPRARLTFLVGATVLLDAVATVAMYLLEHEHRGSGFDGRRSSTPGTSSAWNAKRRRGHRRRFDNDRGR